MSFEVDPKRKKRYVKALRREERRWKAKCGPVKVRFVEPQPRKGRKGK